MQGLSNRLVVIISALLTLLVLVGATLAVGFRNGWLHVATDAPNRAAVTNAGQSDVAVHREALDDGARRFTDPGDDDHRERGPRQRDSDDD